MPKRTNTFQQVVAIVHSHMAKGAKVKESAMVTPIRGGDPREVDVLITSSVGGHDVRVGLEACKLSNRKATVEWVERMKGKHDDLPTDKLVLFSASGFTKNALRKAEDHGIATVAAEPFSEKELENQVLRGLKSIWPKFVTFSLERAKVWVRQSDAKVVWFRAPADLNLFLDDGSEFGSHLKKAVEAKIKAQWGEIIEQIELHKITRSVEREFIMIWRPFSGRINDTEKLLHARKEDTRPPELHPILQVELRGRAKIEVQEVGLTYMRLGQTRVAYGALTLNGRPGLVVASDGSGQKLLTIRVSGDVPSSERHARVSGDVPSSERHARRFARSRRK